jgi:hypothetical protein
LAGDANSIAAPSVFFCSEPQKLANQKPLKTLHLNCPPPKPQPKNNGWVTLLAQRVNESAVCFPNVTFAHAKMSK